MKDINLLPPELKPNSVALKYSKRLNRLAINIFILFFITVTVLGGALFALKFRLNSLSKIKTNLESNLVVLQESEQKLILVKDRLAKINLVMALDKSKASINALDSINNNLPDEVFINGAEINGGTLSLNISTGKSQNLSTFLKMMSNLNFQNVNLNGFSYDSKLGYRIEIVVVS